MHDEFPTSAVPLLPVLDRLTGNDDVQARPVFCRAASLQTILVESGTAAIALTLKSAGVGAGDEVLVPSVNCPSIREAVKAVGAKTVLYRTEPDLSVDIIDLRRKTGKAGKALIVIQFFGFVQPLEEIRAHCDETGLLLIEDCAHAWLRYERGHESELADAIVGSATKFFPVAEGGFVTVIDRARFSHFKLRRRSPYLEIRSLANVVEVAISYSRLPVLGFLVGWMFRLRKRIRGDMSATKHDASGNDGDAFEHIDPESFDSPMSLTSGFLYRRHRLRSAAARRRSIFERLVSGFDDTDGITPLMPELPESVIPYMVPFLLTDPARKFPALKLAGVPMYRWEDVGESDCEIAADYRESLIQLPCHETLTAAELEFIRVTVIKVLGET